LPYVRTHGPTMSACRGYWGWNHGRGRRGCTARAPRDTLHITATPRTHNSGFRQASDRNWQNTFGLICIQKLILPANSDWVLHMYTCVGVRGGEGAASRTIARPAARLTSCPRPTPGLEFSHFHTAGIFHHQIVFYIFRNPQAWCLGFRSSAWKSSGISRHRPWAGPRPHVLNCSLIVFSQRIPKNYGNPLK